MLLKHTHTHKVSICNFPVLLLPHRMGERVKERKRNKMIDVDNRIITTPSVGVSLSRSRAMLQLLWFCWVSSTWLMCRSFFLLPSHLLFQDEMPRKMVYGLYFSFYRRRRKKHFHFATTAIAQQRMQRRMSCRGKSLQPSAFQLLWTFQPCRKLNFTFEEWTWLCHLGL